MPRVLAAHDAGEPQRLRCSSQTSSRSGSRSSVWPFSSVSCSPSRAKRTTMSPSSSRVVVGVQRLPEFEHHVVGDVDDRRDRADAASARGARFIHAGVGARASMPSIDPRREARAGVLVLDRARRASRRWSTAHRRDRRQRDGAAPVIAATSRAMPSIDRQSARFGRELQRDQRVVESERLPQVGAERERRGQHEQARRVVGRVPSSVAEHSMPCDSTPRIVVRADREAAGQLRAVDGARARASRRRRSARRRRSCRRSAPPTSTVQTRSRSASGCCSTLSILPTTTPRERRARRRATSSTSSPAIVSASAQPVGVERRIDERAQPVFGEFHRRSARHRPRGSARTAAGSAGRSRRTGAGR